MAQHESEFKPWQTYHTECGRGRVTYHPEWSVNEPWVSYIEGTAGRHFAELGQAHAYFKARGMVLKGAQA